MHTVPFSSCLLGLPILGCESEPSMMPRALYFCPGIGHLHPQGACLVPRGSSIYVQQLSFAQEAPELNLQIESTAMLELGLV